MLAPPSSCCQLSAALLALLLCRFGHAQQQSPRLDGGGQTPLGLTWVSSDPSCDGSAVAARAVELVRGGVTPRPTQARAQVRRDGGQWVVDLQTRSESQIGRRTLRGESCKEIEQAIALLLAMIMESEARAEVAAAPPAPAPVPAPPAALGVGPSSGAPERDEPPAPHRPPSEGLGFALRLEGTAAMGLQPSLGLGATGSLGVAYGPLELHVGGSYWPASRMPILSREGFLEMSRKVVGAAVCFRVWDSGSFQALPCVGPEWIWIDHQAVGLRINQTGDQSALPSLTASLELRLRVAGPFFATITPGLTWERPVPFNALECERCTSTQVFQTWPLGPRLGAGFGARF